MAVYEGERPGPYTPVFEDVFVVPENLHDFAQLISSDLGALRDAWSNAQADMEGGPDPNFPGKYANGYNYAAGYPELAYEGDDGMREGNAFYRAYFQTIGAEIWLMEDMLKGLETLRAAAEKIHADYNASDASNAGSMEGAFAAYEQSSVLDALGEATDPVEGGDNEQR